MEELRIKWKASIRVTDNALPRDKVNRGQSRIRWRVSPLAAITLIRISCSLRRLISRPLFGARVEFSTPARRALVPFEGNDRLWLRLPLHCVYLRDRLATLTCPLCDLRQRKNRRRRHRSALSNYQQSCTRLTRHHRHFLIKLKLPVI